MGQWPSSGLFPVDGGFHSFPSFSLSFGLSGLLLLPIILAVASPQGLYTISPVVWNDVPTDRFLRLKPTSPKSLLQHHFLSQAYSDHLVEIWNPPNLHLQKSKPPFSDTFHFSHSTCFLFGLFFLLFSQSLTMNHRWILNSGSSYLGPQHPALYHHSWATDHPLTEI